MSCIRFEHFAPAYLINVVSCCRLMADSNMLPKVMSQALLYHDIPQSVRDEHEEVGIPPLSVNRGEGKHRELNITLNVNLSDCIELGTEEEFYIPCGLVLGYPLILIIQRVPSLVGEKDTWGMYWSMRKPSRYTGDGVRFERGVCVHVKWKCEGSDEQFSIFTKIADLGQGWGVDDVFGKPWEEVVYDGSPYFSEGKMAVEATITDVVYWHEKQEKEEEEEKEKEEQAEVEKKKGE